MKAACFCSISTVEDCKKIEAVHIEKPHEARRFIEDLIRPDVDARLFEIVSFAILKAHYGEQSIYWGWQRDSIVQEFLILYKTGRTNANDGGIDFVMKPLGRFFQVTETMDVHKYLLDIEKVQRFPLTFVIKSAEAILEIKNKIRLLAERRYPVKVIVDRYMDCIEEVINVPELIVRFDAAAEKGLLSTILSEIIMQSKVEFNFDEDESEIEDETENEADFDEELNDGTSLMED